MTDVEKQLMDEFVSEDFVMTFTGYSRKSIQTYRSNGSDKIPPSKKVGKQYIYPAKEFKAWLAKQKTIRSVA